MRENETEDRRGRGATCDFFTDLSHFFISNTHTVGPTYSEDREKNSHLVLKISSKSVVHNAYLKELGISGKTLI